LIPRNTPATQLEGKVHLVPVPEKLKQPGAVSDLATLGALHASVDLQQGDQLVASRFVSAGEAARGKAPDGLGTVVISLDVERALGGKVRPGDKVGVIVTFDQADPAKGQAAGSKFELENIQVTEVAGPPPPAADATTDGISPLPTGNYLITLAASDKDIETLVYAKEKGRIWLSAEPAKPAATPASGSGS